VWNQESAAAESTAYRGTRDLNFRREMMCAAVLAEVIASSGLREMMCAPLRDNTRPGFGGQLVAEVLSDQGMDPPRVMSNCGSA
jgi:hypothetical protein